MHHPFHSGTGGKRENQGARGHSPSLDSSSLTASSLDPSSPPPFSPPKPIVVLPNSTNRPPTMRLGAQSRPYRKLHGQSGVMSPWPRMHNPSFPQSGHRCGIHIAYVSNSAPKMHVPTSCVMSDKVIPPPSTAIKPLDHNLFPPTNKPPGQIQTSC